MCQRGECHVRVFTCLSCDAFQTLPRGLPARSRLSSPSAGTKMTPGFSFAWPGPADGVGSLAYRQVDSRRGRSVGRAGSRGFSVVAGMGSSCCHRYYDQLSLPNVLPTRLRHPARCVVPAFPAFWCMDRPCGGAFPMGALVTRWTPAAVAPLWSATSEQQETMRLSRVPVSSLDRHALVYDPGGLRGDWPLASPRMLRSS
jgi:hypothetical protein